LWVTSFRMICFSIFIHLSVNFIIPVLDILFYYPLDTCLFSNEWSHIEGAVERAGSGRSKGRRTVIKISEKNLFSTKVKIFKTKKIFSD
ncbi:hypothetical protein ACQP3J_28910, partial [Escherichia coli]